MNNARWMIAGALALLLGGMVVAQNIPMPGPDDGEEEEPEDKGSSLQPRPEDDPKTEAWVESLGAARPMPLSVEEGVLLHHVMTPEGDRFYYYRKTEDVRNDPDKPDGPRYVLYTVGRERSETEVAETGASDLPPLFLDDGRMLFVTRRYDMNEDGQLDELDEATLMVSNRDGGNLRHAATLKQGDVPVATWRESGEVLIAEQGEEDVNGWIVSLNLISGERVRILRGFNVELVLDDGRLLIERQQPPAEDEGRPRGFNRWGQPVIPEEEEEQPEPTLLDHSSHIIFNPEDGTEVTLFTPSRRARITVHGDNSFFGHQEPDNTNDGGNPFVRWPGQVQQGATGSEVLIVDDPQHRDTRAPSQRFDYESIGWVQDRGLLVIETGNLGSRLLLFDRSLNVHRLADFELTARGFQASKDGLTVGWLEVEDTDRNGHLEPWKDQSRPHYFVIE